MLSLQFFSLGLSLYLTVNVVIALLVILSSKIADTEEAKEIRNNPALAFANLCLFALPSIFISIKAAKKNS